MLKNQKGITLIALVITIIVLLILAGVSIAMLTGPNGLLTRAEDAKTATIKAEAVERINTELQAQYANILAGKNFDENTTIEGKINNDNVSVTVAVAQPSDSAKGSITMTIDKPSSGVTAGSIAWDDSINAYKVTLAK